MSAKRKDSAMAEIRIFNTILFLIFLVLKLCHVINWSWWWVAAPFWAPVALIVAVAPFVFIYGLIKESRTR